MSEEFDIMKPISLDLDIAPTMFDKPPTQEHKETEDINKTDDEPVGIKPVIAPMASVKRTISQTSEITPLAEKPIVVNTTGAEQSELRHARVPTVRDGQRKPEESGVGDVNFGYLTADEAKFMGKLEKDIPNESSAPSVDTGAVKSPELDNPLERALGELENINNAENRNVTETARPTGAFDLSSEGKRVRNADETVDNSARNLKIIIIVVFCVLFVLPFLTPILGFMAMAVFELIFG